MCTYDTVSFQIKALKGYVYYYIKIFWGLTYKPLGTHSFFLPTHWLKDGLEKYFL